MVLWVPVWGADIGDVFVWRMAIIILERTMLYLALLQGEILNISQTGIYSATYYFFGCQVFALKLCALLLSQEIKAGN